MDIVSPDLVWLDGKCYRINDFVEPGKRDEYNAAPFEEKSKTFENDDYCDDDDDEIDKIEFTQNNNGRFKSIINVPTFYFGFIIGSKGSTVKRLMSETRTDIKIPHGERRDITITGFSKKNIATAIRRINMIVMAARKKQKPTHFVSIPTINEEIIKNFNLFKEDILKNPPQGVDESIFIEPSKLHLTMAVMSLVDNEERTFASNLLQEAKQSIIDPLLKIGPIEADIVGVSYMNDDPKMTHVLYGEIVEKGNHKDSLKIMMEKLVDFFAQNGFDTSRQSGKLHVTLMKSKDNTIEGSASNSNNKRTPFDSSWILEKYSKYPFGKVKLEEIHLSAMHTVADNGYYRSTIVLPMK